MQIVSAGVVFIGSRVVFMFYDMVNKEKMAVLWLAKSYEVISVGGGPGVEPHGLPIQFYITI